MRVGGTLGAKDGAVEPTRTYPRRVPTGRTRPQLKISANHLDRCSAYQGMKVLKKDMGRANPLPMLLFIAAMSLRILWVV